MIALEFFGGADLDVVAFEGRHVDAVVDEVLYKSCLVALAQDDDAHGAVCVGGVLCEAVELGDDRFCFWPVDQLVPASFAVALGHMDHFQRGKPVRAVLTQQDELVVGAVSRWGGRRQGVVFFGEVPVVQNLYSVPTVRFSTHGQAVIRRMSSVMLSNGAVLPMEANQSHSSRAW
ncbi:hypothetical protein AQJ27_35635 [Streptomyces olivochromogenes]|uniref:Uncharacterized protein n=1 Tax=Streptomyces olivochromogenes TaxID=1963 RepID=A0A250VQT6_STROL|nr:hypothetical protein AQJ27_35635 [Streptomyces olivochromogenes]GAX56557.1 hypothetical protein SO3561_08125 [Streptomyces olivochromogenes]